MGMSFLEQPQMLWLLVFIVMVVVELVSMGLTSIWFAGGALAALFVSLPDTPVQVQIVVFLIVSFVLLLLVRPWARKHFNHEREKTNAQSLIGQSAVVIEEIDNVHAKGRVLIRGQEWSARSVRETECIPVNTSVRVQEISGVKLIVEKADV
ncbi:MAG: NfeD family protein [Clostridiales bacterium]|nr:NfeD family protein [Clostridiales bacterium]MCD8110176.1 NfeD family protein [Clostridiales bacterium]MCD8133680.1 NfeD family protein [Clostridiales bacterium]